MMTIPARSQAYELCFPYIFCETAQEKAEREEQEALEQEALEELQAFLVESHLGETPNYKYNQAQLQEDTQHGWRLILVINRSINPNVGQTLSVYLDGMPFRFWPVSTALEGPKKKKNGSVVNVTTRTGRFMALDIHRNWYSREWQEDLTEMIFYGPPRERGVAIHAAQDRKADQNIGKRYSAGCTHLHKQDSEELFELVKKYRKQTLIIVHETSIADVDRVPSDRDLQMIQDLGY